MSSGIALVDGGEELALSVLFESLQIRSGALEVELEKMGESLRSKRIERFVVFPRLAFVIFLCLQPGKGLTRFDGFQQPEAKVAHPFTTKVLAGVTVISIEKNLEGSAGILS